MIRMTTLALPACAAAILGLSIAAAQDAGKHPSPASVNLRPPAPDTRAAQNLFGPPPTMDGTAGRPAPNSEAPAPALFFPNAMPPRQAMAAIPADMPPPRVIVESLPMEAKAAAKLSQPLQADQGPVPGAASSTVRTADPAVPASPSPLIPSSQPLSAPASQSAMIAANQSPLVPSNQSPLVPASHSAGSALVHASTQMPIITQPAAPPSGPQPLIPAGGTARDSMAKSSAAVLTYPNRPLSARNASNVLIECIAPESVSVGQPFEYRLVIRNAGTAAVANVRVEDELPRDLVVESVEPPAEQLGQRLGWNLGLLEPNTEKIIRMGVRSNAEGQFASRAIVSFTAAAEARTQITRPIITAAVDGPTSARVGEEATFQIRVGNIGTGPASNLVIKAALTEGFHHPAGKQIEAAIERLAPGETKTITLRALATKCGQQACTIGVDGLGFTAEPATCTLQIVEPMLKTAISGPAKCLVRGEPEFRVELSNPGTAETDPVQLWAMLPEGFEFVSASDGGMFQPANRTVSWSIPVIAAGSARHVSFKAKALAPAEGTIRVVAQSGNPTAGSAEVVAVTARPHASRVLEAKSEAAVRIEGVAAIRFDVVDVEDPVEVGKDALYDIRIVNQGTGPCTNLLVTIHLAEGTAIAGATGPSTARGQGQTIAFDPLPRLEPQSEAIYRVRIRGQQAGDMKLRVQVSCDEIRTPVAKEENTRFVKD